MHFIDNTLETGGRRVATSKELDLTHEAPKVSGARRRLRIAYVTVADPKDRKSWSGIIYCMARALEKHCGDIFCVGPLSPFSLNLGKAIRLGVRLLKGQLYLHTHTASASKKFGKMAARRMSRQTVDVVFAPAGSEAIAHLRTEVPIVYLSDTTCRLLHSYYPGFKSLLPSHLRAADQIEQLAIQNSRRLVYGSSWAARSAIKDYHADPAFVHVVPFGANFDGPPPREDVLKSPLRDRCRLLFVGVNWERKGGKIAFETLLELERLGVPAQLTVVGCLPPKGFRHPGLRVVPFLDKNDPRQREQIYRLYQESHFFILPTRADCSPIVISEANAFGLPVLSTDTGGVPEAVRNGLNGFVLPLEARGDQYAVRLRDIFNDCASYEALRASSRGEFDSRLNWDAWGEQIREILWAAVAPEPSAACPPAFVCDELGPAWMRELNVRGRTLSPDPVGHVTA